METNYSNTIEEKSQPKYRDRLFIAIFGKDTERSKRWRLDLYNVLNGTSYTDPDALELNTIENVIFIKMYNDVSFLVDGQMTLYEQQSETNSNMPLRGFFYFAQLYQKHLAKKNLTLHQSTLIKIPNPRFIVFYNGDTKRKERYKLRLSDAFEIKDASGDFEWTADVININQGANETLVKKCKSLYDYVRLVGRISDNKKKEMEIGQAVREAVDWAIKQNFLEGFVKEQKQEIIAMCLTEFDEENAIRGWKQDGIEMGRQEKAVEDALTLVRKYNASPESAASDMGAPLDKVLEALTPAPAN
ncbi:MAG: hypothetical protein VZQ47_06910 [Treponema sp.]|nr:hypothetical protein [Treponema sp.]MEE3435269.1 hypothetical protein [Treponema sp.]